MPAQPVVLLWTETGRTVDSAWLERLKSRLTDPPLSLTAAAGAGLESVDAGPSDLPALARIAVQRWPDRGVLLLRAGLELPDSAVARLAWMLAGEGPPGPVMLPGSYLAQVDPLAGQRWPLDNADLDSLASTCGDRYWFPAGETYPDCLLLAPAVLARMAAGEAVSRPWIADDGYIGAEDREPGRERPEGAPAPLGHLRRRLMRLAGEAISELPRLGLDGKPVTLHISHNWGGGVARWIEDLIAGDGAAGHHLVLSAVSDFKAGQFGQWLELHALSPGRGRIRELALAPAIYSTAEHHPVYAARLGEIIRRFGVGRVLVSSLIGHSLDCLGTGLPTCQILHDYYPAWPLLDQDPLPYTGAGEGPDLARALNEHGREFLFAERRPEHWIGLTRAWRRQIERHRVRLVAPTRHVAARWQRLLPEADLTIDQIPHGFKPWPDPVPDRAEASPRSPLHLVVLGRLNPGKGLDLLIDALDGLRPHARISAVGAGRQGHRLFGRAGVDIILDYARDDLPRLLDSLKPDAALFLSTAPETWNYTLSEARSLGLVPIATNLGSFPERIRHGVDGILVDPAPGALVEAVSELARNPGRLGQLRSALPAEPGLTETAGRYRELLPPQPPPPPEWTAVDPGSTQSAWLSGRLADREAEVRTLRAERAGLDAELARRSHWAEMMERQFRDRSRWAEKLQDENRALAETLSEERRRAADRIETLEAELAQILASRSWRLTRPLRVAARVGRNARERGVINPVRWPRLVARLFHHLRLRGWRQTLHLMQAPAIDAPAPATVRATASPDPEARLEPVSLPVPHHPRVSIIIPVHNQVHFTAACLASLQAATSVAPFEVIVVDDASTDGTAEHLRRCRGLKVISNDENLGFIGSCNRGARAAVGKYLVFLNNDTTVTQGWLEALLQPFSEDPQVGIVGARLVYPDGRLQEAGGIIFSDGAGWNYGRGEDPDRPEFNFRCEADYVSGACLAISKSRFERFGGFDDRYAPAYYEDTDLCFKAREARLRVIYQPACTVIHHEGATSGTDESAGTKRYQALNREKFRARWAEALKRQPPHDPDWDRPLPVRRHRHHFSPKRALVIDAVTPTPDQDSGSLRMSAMLELLRDQGYLSSFIPENLCWVPGYSARLQSAGIEVVTAPWILDIEDWLSAYGDRLDVVLVSRHYVLRPLVRLIRHHCPRARLIFDTVDLHYLREEREAEVTGSTETARRARATRTQELSLVRAADATLVVSPVERALLREQVPEARVEIVSNIHMPAATIRDWAHRDGLMFVGGFQHTPNVDAVQWLIESIFPRIRESLPQVRLHLIGSRMPKWMRNLEAPGVAVHGFVPDLRPFLEACRLSLAPLRFGAGVKGKVNQAMAYGLPVVATPCAAEGIFLTPGEEILTSNDPKEFADLVVAAYTDAGLWRKLSAAGLENVRRHFSPGAARRGLSRVLEVAADTDRIGASAA